MNDKIPDSEILDIKNGRKDFDAVHGFVVVFVVEQNPLLDLHFFGGVANVHHAEDVVGQPQLLQGHERRLVRFPGLPCEAHQRKAVAKVVFESVNKLDNFLTLFK